MKPTILGLLCMCITACATSSSTQMSAAATPTSTAKYRIPPEALGPGIKMFVDENMYVILCEQDGYRSCFNVGRDQCVSELSKYNDVCVEKSTQQVPVLDSRRKAETYASTLAMCLVSKHVRGEHYPVESTMQCIGAMKWEQQKLRASTSRSQTSM